MRTSNWKQDISLFEQLLFRGWTVIRFWEKDIMKHTDECVKVVEETIFDVTAG
jgi:DNA mismatch endonuclease (patch repair protein)